jgi:hypothetical protein
MTTESRPWKKYVTKGEWIADFGSHLLSPSSLRLIAVVQHGPSQAADVIFIKEASKVFHQTGMTPGELAERVRELKFELEDALEELKSLRFSRGL